MKWLITLLTVALITTGCILETPDPCDASPISCDSEPVIKEPVPATPSIQATPGVESISVSWSGSTRAEAYMLYHNTSKPVGTSNRIDLANVTSYSFSDLDASKTYYYSVVGYNKTGAQLHECLQPLVPPRSPRPPPASQSTLGAGSNTITWPNTNGATGGYTLYYSTSTPVTTSDNAFAVSGTSYTHTGLTGGTPIYYAVSAYNAGGHSALSSETSSTPNPATPTGIAAVAGIGREHNQLERRGWRYRIYFALQQFDTRHYE